MIFQQLKQSIVDLLGNNANDLFRVYGYQTSPKSAGEFLGNDRAIRVFYERGKFPRSKSSAMGDIEHDVHICFEFIVTEQTEVDVSVLSNPASTPEEKAAALAAAKEAANSADDSMDDFFALVFQILMDARNRDLGLPDFTLGLERWVDDFAKDEPVSSGEFVVLTAKSILTTSVTEPIQGETPVPADPNDSVFIEIGINGDETQKTSVDNS